MKRVIDIEKDYYEILKYNVENEQKYKPWEIIANSTPYDERPQGEWIKTDGNSFECPFCHRLFDFGDNYCGFCGADMRKGGTE